MSSLVELAFAEAEARDERGDRRALRAQGVVPTPVALARYAVTRVDQLLRRELGIERGLASDRVVVVDPAVGTGVWLAAVLEQTRGVSPERTRSLIGIDLAPDTLVRTEALLQAEAARQRAEVTLRQANTLELTRVLSVEDERVLVLLGNPPWAARSLSRGSALSDRWLGEFRRDHEGNPLGERRIGVLSDDYVRFFRWGLEQARSAAGGALLCLATNASFLDGPVHRGMRAALLSSFDRLELLDLGGNALISRDDAHDENMFGVRVGAALTWALRRPGVERRQATVAFAAVRGKLDEKLATLAGVPAMAALTPTAPWFRFRQTSASSARATGFSLAEAFVLQREGVQTNRDALCIASSPAAVEAQLRAFLRGEVEVPASRHFDPIRVRSKLSETLERGALSIEPIAYRPLDQRFVAAWSPLCHRPRRELLRAAAQSELCLLAVRKERGSAPFNLFAPALHVADACYLSVRSSCRTRVFPSRDAQGRDNLAPRVAAELAQRVGRAVTSRELILYALSVLGSSRHRATHEEQLKLDYPVLPWPRDAHQLERAVATGAQFVDALWASSPDLTRPFAVHISETTPVDLKRLRFEPAKRTLEQAGTLVISELDEACWEAHVGHHALVRSALRAHPAPNVGLLVSALERAARWTRAECAADVLYTESFGADAAAR